MHFLGGFHTWFFGGGGGEGGEFVGRCHSAMHEFDYTNIQVFGEIEAGGGDNSRATHPLYETLLR